MMHPSDTSDYGFLSSKAALNELHARQQLAAAYRIFDYLGWAELIYAHLSLKVPGENEHFLINQYGLLYSEVTASNLVKVDREGNVIGPNKNMFNTAGFISHSALHQGRADIHCVLHAHTTAGLAVASSAVGIQPTNIYSAQLFESIAYHDFEGITLYPDEGTRLLRNIGGHNAVVMRNHGLFALGRTVSDALNVMWLLNRACEVQVAASSLGALIEISPDVSRRCANDSFHFNSDHGGGFELFSALVRKIDQIDPTYRN